jgi:hypothetical protein
MSHSADESPVERLLKACPVIGKPLSHARQLQDERLSFFLQETGRLQGLDCFSAFLQAVIAWSHRFEDLRAFTFLLQRAGADFVTAIHAVTTGFHAIAWESMRDVMEVELLIEEFLDSQSQLKVWAEADQSMRRTQFSHGALRKRKAARLGVKPSELPDAVDFAGHSMVLHVNPIANPFGGRGVAKEAVDVGADACFWDIYQHSFRIFRLLLAMLGTFGESHSVEGWSPPSVDKFLSEHKEAMGVQSIIMDKLKTSGQAGGELEGNGAT